MLKLKTRKYWKNKKGSLALTFAIAVPVLAVGVGVAIDMSQYQIVKSKFNAALDTSVLAASVVESPRDPEAVANTFFKANFPPSYMGKISFANQSVAGPVKLDISKANNILSYKGKAEGTVNLGFSQILGLSGIKLAHTAKVERVVKQNVEIVLTIDVSPSMCTLNVANSSNTVADPACKKLNTMKMALKEFVNTIFSNSAINNTGMGTVKIGIVPYNHKVLFPKVASPTSTTMTYEQKVPYSIRNIEPNGYYTDLSDASPLPPIVPLTSNKANLLAAIDAISINQSAQGWTRTTVGTHAAALMLDPSQNSFYGGEAPAAFADPLVDKVIIQMTDGASVGCCYGSVNGDTTKQYQYIYRTDMTYQKTLCQQLKAPATKAPTDTTTKLGGDITIFSIVFDVSDQDLAYDTTKNITGEFSHGGKWVKDVFNSCSSNKQFYFDVGIDPNASSASSTVVGEELIKVYSTIAQYFYKTRIVE